VPKTDKPWQLFKPNKGHRAIVELQKIGDILPALINSLKVLVGLG